MACSATNMSANSVNWRRSDVTKLKSKSNLLRIESISPNGPGPLPLKSAVLDKAFVKFPNNSSIGFLPALIALW